ncbi:dicarboxylate transporter/tellurite-resistance protein TehA [Acidisoma cellulosilytica]|uniref:Dicarboxylate transporter/tellurite-resistance protein TehA n=1 Tax=Acidisoma cellulosilyticum TaxID=2802395 RepID=A0A963Z408_9PROT|nr:dicarboxylate transporter/tellurite-resistance protein TehA [Acidisoma cellulosilyticum]MCB8882490.1 dicarboxylate transporter/tellurite-resistance protein TehA [Acidisoma cellulosilyticum]
MPRVPAAMFGIVLGLSGLGTCWRLAHRLWGMPSAVGEIILAAATVIWALLIIAYIGKWLNARTEAIAELGHPVQCCFIGLIGAATMLIGNAMLPYSRPVTVFLFACGLVFTLGFALWRTGLLWQGEREHADTTAVLYLPAVAGTFVAGTSAAGLGLTEWGSLLFGMGFFTWIAIESVLLHRLYTGPQMAVPLRPTLGIQLAPPVVGAVTYLAVTPGPPATIVHGMLGYGLFLSLLLIRLIPWIRKQPFAASYWAFTFGGTALAAAPMLMLLHGDHGAVGILAPILFVGANILVGIIAVGTVRLLMAGKLFPKPAAPQPNAA